MSRLELTRPAAGEKLSDDFDKLLFQDREHVDLLLIMGTSLAVAPVADVLGEFNISSQNNSLNNWTAYIPHSIPQVLINKTPVIHANPDVSLLSSLSGLIGSQRSHRSLCLAMRTPSCNISASS